MESAAASKLLRNTLSGIGLRAVTWIAAFIVFPILLARIGEVGVGVIVLVNTLLGYIAFLGVGMPAGTEKYVAEFETKGERAKMLEVIRTSVGFFLAIGGVVAVLMGLFAVLGGMHLFELRAGSHRDAELVLYIAAAIALVSWPGNAFSNSLAGVQEHHKRNVVQGVSALLGHALSVTAALLDGGVVWVFLGQQAGSLLRTLWLLAVLKKVVPDYRLFPLGIDRPTFEMMFSLTAWIMVRDIAKTLVYKADHAILGAVISVASVAVYEVVVRVSYAVRDMVAMFTGAMMPAVSATEASGDDGGDKVREFALVAARYCNAFSGTITVTAAYLCGPFIVLWVGEKYAEWVWLALFAVIARLWIQSNAVLGPIFYGVGEARRPAYIGISTALLNVGLSIWWVHLWGLPGVIFATLAAFVVAVVLQYIILFPLIELPRAKYLWGSVLRPILPSLVVAAALIPAWESIQRIDSWLVLFAVATALGGSLTLLTWFVTVSAEHRTWVTSRIRRRLGRK